MFQGKRVRLRAVSESDFKTFCEWWSDPEVMTHQTTGPIKLRQPQTDEEMFRTWSKDSDSGIAFSIELLEDNMLIGECNLWGYTSKNQCGTTAIIVGKSFWNQGYGTEALRLLVSYAFNELNLHRVQLTVNGDNARAIRAYEKVGFVVEGRAREFYFRAGKWRDMLYMGALQHDLFELELASGR
jgi:RimJ/RimL family protein N-acetyltransferase